MSKLTVKIIPMSERDYELIPIDKIKVLNSRNRDKAQFDENICNIKEIGLLKPIVVNKRPFKKHGYYELVCGEGRQLAHKELGEKYIQAEVINCDKKKALLVSLVENIARVPPDTIWFAQELKRMKDAGMSIKKICAIATKTETYIVDYIRLVELGEERLIKGVEQEIFPMTFATIIVKSSSSDIQHVLMDAFDSGMISSGNATRVRNLIERRLKGKRDDRRRRRASAPEYTIKELRSDITRVTQEKESFVHEVGIKENRLLSMIHGLNEIWEDEQFKSILIDEKLGERPVLSGEYNI